MTAVEGSLLSAEAEVKTLASFLLATWESVVLACAESPDETTARVVRLSNKEVRLIKLVFTILSSQNLFQQPSNN